MKNAETQRNRIWHCLKQTVTFWQLIQHTILSVSCPTQGISGSPAISRPNEEIQVDVLVEENCGGGKNGRDFTARTHQASPERISHH